MKHTWEFIKIFSIVLGGGVACTLVIMWVLGRYLPDQGESTDPYEKWIEENTNKLKDEDQ
jgi:hypothetical protein